MATKNKGSVNIADVLKKRKSLLTKKKEKTVNKKPSVSVVEKEVKVKEKVDVKLTNKSTISKDGRGTKKEAEYLLFIEWVATPLFERTPKTQKELALQLKVSEPTLSNWKDRTGFWKKVEKSNSKWGKFRTADLMGALYTQILTSRKPTGRDVLVWLQYYNKFNPKFLMEDETPLERKYGPEERKALARALLLSGLANVKQTDVFLNEDKDDEPTEN